MREAPPKSQRYPLPEHLAGNEPRGLISGEAVAQYELGDYRNFVYLILDWKTRDAAIVDPQTDLDGLLGALREHSFRLGTVFLTHTHFDHIAGLPRLLKADPALRVIGHSDDLRRLAPDVRARSETTAVVDGQVIAIGGIDVRILHTPGHSAGEISLSFTSARPYLMTGDTVFIRDCGRTDLESGSTRQMFETLQRLRQLPPETVILPGHHYVRECATTLGTELEQSAPFRCKSVQELEALP